MAYVQKSASFHKILILVLGVAFGLVALAVGYQAMNNSADIRSKAAENQTIYKQWEFNGADTEGWISEKPYTAITQNGYLTINVQNVPAIAILRNFQVNTRLPQGLKTIAFSMAVGSITPVTPTPTPSQCPPPPKCPNGAVIVGSARSGSPCPVYMCPTTPNSQTTPSKSKSGFGGYVQGVVDERDDTMLAKTSGACTLEAKLCPDGSYVGRSGARCDFLACPPKAPIPSQMTFTGLVFYKLANKNTFERPVEFKGLVNGKLQEYKVNLSDASDVQIERIRIMLISSLRPGNTISVDWIRLLGPVMKPTIFPTPTPFPSSTPTPTPTACYSGLKDTVSNKPTACASGYALGMTYTCWDGYKGVINEGTVCYSIADMKNKATIACAGRSNCSGGTTAPRPSTYPTVGATSGPKPSSYPTAVYMTPTPVVPSPYFIPAQ